MPGRRKVLAHCISSSEVDRIQDAAMAAAAAALGHCRLLHIHGRAGANGRKYNGMIAILAGHAANMTAGMRTAAAGVIGGLYPAVANDVFGANIEEFPSAKR